MARILLIIKGQTCNKFWSYSNYLMRCIYDDKILVILAPDIVIRDFDNFRNSEYVKLPFYFDFVNVLIGYDRNIAVLKLLFENRLSRFILKWFQNFLNYEYVEENSGSYKDNRRLCQHDRIVNIFKPNSLFYEHVNNLFKATQGPGILKIGIHIRLGDYRFFENGKYYFSLDVYKRCMRELLTIFANNRVVFFISSNANLEITTFSSLEVLFVDANNITPTLDLLGLSECDYILGPPSTFSAWAAYMNAVPICFLENSEQTMSLESFIDVNSIFS